MRFTGLLWNYLQFVSRRFVEDRCLMIAGSLTYTSLLALVPLFTVTIVLTSHIAIIRDLIFEVKAFVLKSLVPDVGGRAFSQYVEQFSQNAAQLTVIGTLILVGTALAMIFTIDTAFNDIWRARRRRSLWKRLTAYFAVLGVGPLLIGASLTLTSYLVHWSKKLDRVLPLLDDWLLKLVPFAMSTLALAVAYRVMPARHVPIRHAVAGALFAGLLFEVVKHLFVNYVMRVPTYGVVYGAFASVPLFFFWLFCCWIVVLIGAETAATLSFFGHGNTRAVLREAGAHSRHDALRLIDALAGDGTAHGLAALRRLAPMPIEVAEDILHTLTDAGLVLVDRRGRYRLARARDAILDSDVEAALSR